ncbi:MAG: tetratricopeptide repeat protein, partial [Alphaproteobacteria bacterium]|nr:tetratricopeptide repeat protein [Alphaproteobacteria bacterium]
EIRAQITLMLCLRCCRRLFFSVLCQANWGIVLQRSHSLHFRAIALLIAVAAPAGCGGMSPARGPVHSAITVAPQQIVRVGDRLRDNGDTATAATAYRAALLQEPRNPIVLLRLGDSLRQIGEYREAASIYDALLRVEPRNIDGMRGLASALIVLNDAARARDILQAALALNDQDTRLYSALGVAHDRLGEHEHAQAYYRAGLRIRPGDLTLRGNFALSLILAGRGQEGLQLMRQVAGEPAATEINRQSLALAETLVADRDAMKAAAASPPMPAMAAVIPSPPPPSADQAATTTGATINAATSGLLFQLKQPPLRRSVETQPSSAQPDAPKVTAIAPAANGARNVDARFQVQFGALDSEANAQRHWQSIAGRLPADFATYAPGIYRVEAGTGAAIFRLRTEPLPSRADAERLCAALKERNVNCFVVRADPGSQAALTRQREPAANIG